MEATPTHGHFFVSGEDGLSDDDAHAPIPVGGETWRDIECVNDSDDYSEEEVSVMISFKVVIVLLVDLTKPHLSTDSIKQGLAHCRSQAAISGVQANRYERAERTHSAITTTSPAKDKDSGGCISAVKRLEQCGKKVF